MLVMLRRNRIGALRRKGRTVLRDLRASRRRSTSARCRSRLTRCCRSRQALQLCPKRHRDTVSAGAMLARRTMLSGSCLCGSVAYEVDASPGAFVHCHCRTCRKTHGSAFSSVMPVPRSSFRWIKGEELLASFESSPGKHRRFCSKCGSHVVAERTDQPNMLLRLGCLDTFISDKARAHIWRSDAASWFDPKDQTAEFPQGVVAPSK